MIYLAAGLLSVLAAASPAEGRVELELFTDEHTPLTAQREWLQELTKVGVKRLRIVAKGPADTVAIETRGTDSSPIYMVTGIITSNNDLLLPGGRYSLRNAGQAGKWLSDLARNGPPRKPQPRGPFGLTAEEFQAVQTALSQPVGFSTQGTARAATVDKLAGQLGLPVKIDPDVRQSLGSDTVAEELSGLSGGTAMACLLRPAGLCLVPRRTQKGEVECAVVLSEAVGWGGSPSSRGKPSEVGAAPQPTAGRPDSAGEAGPTVWPIGWEPKKTTKTLVPTYYDSFNANVQNVPVTTVLSAVAKRLNVPFLVDHYALARQAIDPQKALVNAPQGQTTYNQLLRKVLAQAKLKSELRVDEAGKPFFWVTTVRTQ